MENELENEDSLNLDETLDSNQETVTEEVVEDNAELEKAKQIAENQRIRAEKAERELKALKTKPVETETPKNGGDLSLKDIRALQDVHDDDIEEVTNYAKFKGITIAEAKNTPLMQNYLKSSAEERASALAASTAPNKRSVNNFTDERIIRDFEQGKVSDKDEDIRRLVEAQLAQKRKEAKGN